MKSITISRPGRAGATGGNLFRRLELVLKRGRLDVEPLVERAELMSMEVSASVWSITIAPPEGRRTSRAWAIRSGVAIWKRENSGTSST